MVVSLTLNHRRKPTVGRADPPVVPVTDEISPNKNSQLIRGQAFRIVAVIEKLAFHSGPHAFTSSIIVAPATITVHALYNAIFRKRLTVEVIRKFNFENVLIYCDPPYVLSTRCRKQYKHEMTDEDHEVLLEALLQHKGPAIISGYSSPLYEERLKDWYREERINYAQNAQQRREVIWCNQKTEKTAQQLTLF